MKRALIIFFVGLSFNFFGQSLNKNHVKTTIFKTPVELVFGIQGDYIPTVPDSLKNVTITYFDGLGNPIQKINYGESSSGNDIITHMEYDNFSRQIKEYLPYADSGTKSPLFRNSALTETLNYPEYVNQFPYSEKEVEFSPIANITKQASPGDDWRLGSNKEIKFDYQTNTTSEVKLYKAIATWDVAAALYTTTLDNSSGSNYYNEKQLYKTITKNENWTSGNYNTTEEFRDKQDKIVLKRTYNNDEINEILDTYYVYDQYGNLSFVIPPLANTYSIIDLSILNDLCYQYKYDVKNRLVEKKLPGKQTEYIVYDKLNRTIATGPAYDPFGTQATGWLISKYDAFGRIVYTGWNEGEVLPSKRTNLQLLQDNSVTIINETKSTPITIDNTYVSYTNNVLTNINGVFKILTINYYDDYNFPEMISSIPATVLSNSSQQVFFNNTIKPKGMPTGSWIRILNDPDISTYEKTYVLYDSKSRPVRNYKINLFGGFTQVDSKIDFSGKIVTTETSHDLASLVPTVVVKNNFYYSEQDRLLKTTQSINGQYPQLIAKNTYDELGKLISKNVGGLDLTGNTSFQKVDYSYNIRGWLTDINDINSLTDVTQDFFAFKINYNTTQGGVLGIDPLYNGNISETYWKTSTDNTLRKYGYKYDYLNRLTDAIYQKPQSSVPVNNSYNENITYDKNGNIKSLLRFGSQDSELYVPILIDKLYYTYQGNRLLDVFDKTNNPNGFTDTTVGTNPTCQYDDFGNMTVDENKGITLIKYNHINLPTQLLLLSNKKITYLYNALGEKIEKVVWENDTSDGITTTYLDGFQYKDYTLKFFPHSEGYINYTAATPGGFGSNGTPESYNYVFNYTDHLGNIRLSYGLDPSSGVVKILEENHYYPFGLKHANYNSDISMYSREEGGMKIKPLPPGIPIEFKYKYNGKEWQDELALNLYDYGARNYDPAIGRWMNIDPLAEVSRRWSPYNYCMNNPVIFIDPDGMFIDTSYIYEKDKKGNYKNKALIEGFEAFAKSKAGIAFLGNFAEKGQIIAGHKYEEGGKFDKKDIDLKYGKLDEDSIASADTKSEIKGKGLQITIGLSATATSVPNIIDDIGHESFLHAELLGEDFYDDKKINLSSVDKDIVKLLVDSKHPKSDMQNTSQHMQDMRDNILEKKIVPILRNYYNSKNIKKTDAEIKKSRSRGY